MKDREWGMSLWRVAVHPVCASAVLVLLTVAAYLPALQGGFIWDDNAHLTENPCVVGPLGLTVIWTGKAARICPLVLTTFWVEHALWGLKPLPYHLVNILMHAACGFVLWRVLRCLKVRGAWLGAALWALHPVQVESVAWITELKNTQSGLFFLLAILSFAKSTAAAQVQDQRKSNIYYAFTLLCAALAMASKSSTVVLPVVLGLCAWWLEGRWRWRNTVKLAPVLVMSVLTSSLSVWTQKLEGAAGPDWERCWLERIAVAGKVVWFYLGKLAWPQPLIFIYPRWETDAARMVSYLPALAVVVVLLVLWRNRNGWGRPAFLAFAYFVVALAPVLGLLNHYFLRYSFVGDHFQYLASMGALALAGSVIVTALRSLGRASQFLSAAICGVLLATLGVLTWERTPVFRDNEILWRDTLAKNPACWLAHNNLGVVLERQGRLQEAESHFRTAVKLNPTFVEALSSLGGYLADRGRVEEGMDHLHRALQAEPGFPSALFNLGNARLSRGQYVEAVPLFEAVLSARPADYEARNNLANALVKLGRLDEAVRQYRLALQLRPDAAEIHENLAAALAAKGNLDEAIVHHRQALRIDPNNAGTHYALGLALALQGKWDEAIGQYAETLRLAPTNAEAQYNLGYAFRVQGRFDEAVTHLREALRLRPELPLAHYNLGCVLADNGQRDDAVAHLKEALRLKPDYQEAAQKLRELGMQLVE